MFDLIHLAMRRAAERFGGKDKTFNAANFAQAFRAIAGVENLLDGREVEVILCGRNDVVQLHGGAHYRILEEKP